MKILTIVESKKILEKYGVKFAKSALAKKPEEAVKIAKSIGYPVAIKAVSPNIVHKTEAGAIEVGISNENELRKSFEKMWKTTKKAAKGKLQGILVQSMVKGGQEILIGGKRDPQFGQIIVFGLGGIFVEVMEDVSFRMVPINRKDASEMIKETKGYKILSGFRGKKYDVKSLEESLMKISKLLEKNKKIVELDINPMIVSSKGAVAVDARIVTE